MQAFCVPPRVLITQPFKRRRQTKKSDLFYGFNTYCSHAEVAMHNKVQQLTKLKHTSLANEYIMSPEHILANYL